MSVPPHIEARLAIHGKLKDVLEKGCERWQAAKEDVSVAAFRRLGRKLKLRTFLDEEFDNAAYKFWKACEQGTKTPEKTWIETERAFQQFMCRLRRIGDPLRTKWFERLEMELQQFEKDWEAYWAIEKLWLEPIRSVISDVKLFKKVDGFSMMRNVATGSDKSFQDFYCWWSDCVSKPYESNSYSKSKSFATAILTGAVCALEFERFEQRRRAIAISLCEIISCSSSIGLSTRSVSISNTALNCIFAPNFLAAGLGDAVGYIYPQVLIINRAKGIEPENEIKELIDVIMCIGAMVLDRKREVNLQSAENLPVLMAFGEAIRLRQAIVSSGKRVDFDLIRKQADNRGANSLMTNDILEFFENPVHLLKQEWDESNFGLVSDASMNKAQLAGIIAQAWAQPDLNNTEAEAEWILRAKDGLEGCPNFLAWSDIYSLCENYMRRRGNKILAEKALVGQRKLTLAALGDEVALNDIDDRRVELEDANILPSQQPRPSKEDEIRRLLLGEPPPLQKRKRQGKR